MVGELVLRGPSLCSGYFNKPVESENAVDDEGWFHTGDLALVDAEEYYFIVDRKKDSFISGGENIYPAEIEQIIYKNPDVEMCAVVGVPDEKWGEVGKAFVVKKANTTLDEATLLEFLQHHLAGYKVPRYIEFIDSLPISGAGKVLKRELVSPST
jgi:fatty-acyl-CoA synthase